MKIRYFAWLRHRIGAAEETVEPPPEVRSVASLKGWLADRHPAFKEALAAKGLVRCAVNQDYVPDDAALQPTDEVAFFPPVTGG
jgi:molybdopterin synthase sulfur carrier subunit